MRRFLAFALILGFTYNCTHKKKGLLFPFFFLGNPHSGSGVPGNSGSPGVVFVPGDGSGNPTTTPSSGTPTDPSGSSGSSGNTDSGNSSSGSNQSSGDTSSNSGTNSSDQTSSNSSNAGSGSGDDSSNNSGSSSGSNASNSSNSSADNSNSTGSSGSNSTSSNASSGSSNSGSDSSSSSGSSSSDNSTASNTSGSSTDTGSGSTPNSDPNTSNTGSNSSGTPTVAVVVVEDPTGTSAFNYNTTINIPLNLTVVDKDSRSVAGATVLVYDENNNILFQGVSDSSGKVSGSLTVPTSVGNITIDISIGGDSISQYISLQDILGINRTIRYAVTLPTVQIADADGDGVPDETDIYPNDATRSTEVAYPNDGVFTLAFEDLYPSAGDADLNDYVIQFKNEEDLNAQGNIVRLRGVYQHVAKGAGYKHQLYIKLPVNVGASITYSLTQADGKVEVATNTVSVTADSLKSGYQIFPDSNKTIRGQNVHPGDVFKPGFIAKLEIVFDSPVSRSQLGSFPYDLFAYVINTNQQIHFPGLYKNANGTDKYLDSTGFPWAIIMPGPWKYPYEGYDIRNPSQTGYAEFVSWVSSGGANYKTWYFDVTNDSKVFPVPSTSSIVGYLFLSVKKFAIFYAIGLVIAGAIAIFFLRRRQSLTI
ncbi:LruC domain-containing protein [Leptospira langatensis]|uniref:LruC domain-containing protein n=1 Tax=Leptospira langatensis TaxID=2484983 RepID=A0A5F1ZPR9_9LEPT|nr:LruC domain-containing protein [Leptospira langatensis]TGK01874.1 LruC domain-containing protein [Leptospira langatensis]TGL39479.1 LruC domain-containing protein [Leptospira langatensis]